MEEETRQTNTKREVEEVEQAKVEAGRRKDRQVEWQKGRK